MVVDGVFKLPRHRRRAARTVGTVSIPVSVGMKKVVEDANAAAPLALRIAQSSEAATR